MAEPVWPMNTPIPHADNTVSEMVMSRFGPMRSSRRPNKIVDMPATRLATMPKMSTSDVPYPHHTAPQLGVGMAEGPHAMQPGSRRFDRLPVIVQEKKGGQGQHQDPQRAKQHGHADVHAFVTCYSKPTHFWFDPGDVDDE